MDLITSYGQYARYVCLGNAGYTVTGFVAVCFATKRINDKRIRCVRCFNITLPSTGDRELNWKDSKSCGNPILDRLNQSLVHKQSSHTDPLILQRYELEEGVLLKASISNSG